jgi:hypothetical protein
VAGRFKAASRPDQSQIKDSSSKEHIS